MLLKNYIDKINNTKILKEPFDHIIIDNFLEDSYYKEILKIKEKYFNIFKEKKRI